MDGSLNGPGGVNGASNGMSRAERFEDEKRRIIETCFGKKDEDGSCAPPPSLEQLESIHAVGSYVLTTGQYWNHTSPISES